uniref:Uncharacterized protein n=1 Tax=Prasinoderma coloniale TaxID=156133 RepID=A0A7R9XYD2_9VIRI
MAPQHHPPQRVRGPWRRCARGQLLPRGGGRVGGTAAVCDPPLAMASLRALYSATAPGSPRAAVVTPEHYMGAAGELLALMCATCWAVTGVFRPGLVADNPLRDRLGYNTVCVGFDTQPARALALPFVTLIAFHNMRYCELDTLRARLELVAGRSTRAKVRATAWGNGLYFAGSAVLGLFLVVSPFEDLWVHFWSFMLVVVLRWFSVAANFYEGGGVATCTRAQLAFLASYTSCTALIPVLATLDFAAYDSRVGGMQTPPVPALVLASLDYAWFVLTALTKEYLPAQPSIQATWELH